MNIIDRPALLELAKHDTITNLGIITYISILAISKLDEETGYPTIKKHTTYKLFKNMKDKMYFINESSVRLAIRRLIEQGFITYMDPEETEIAVLNSGAGHIRSEEHYKSSGYMTLHHLFFNKEFFDLSLPAKKIALIVLPRLDNSPTKHANLNFKSKKNPESFHKWCKILKVNRFAHMKYALNELKSVFNISELNHNTFRFSLNEISKPIVTGTDKLFNFTQVQLGKTEKMLTECNKKNLSFKPNQIKEICEALCGYNMNFGRKVIKELCKTNRDNVKNFLGYTKSIIDKLNNFILV